MKIKIKHYTPLGKLTYCRRLYKIINPDQQSSRYVLPTYSRIPRYVGFTNQPTDYIKTKPPNRNFSSTAI